MSGHPTQESTTEERLEKGKELESLLNELIKSMKDMQLRFTKLEEVESSNQQKTKEKRIFPPSMYNTR